MYVRTMAEHYAIFLSFTLTIYFCHICVQCDEFDGTDKALLLGLANKIENLENVYGKKIDILTDEVRAQRDIIEATQAENKLLKMELQTLRSILAEQHAEKEVQVVKTKRDPVKPSTGTLNEIAFTAKLMHHAINLGVNDTILFRSVVTNLGNAYDPAAGVFTAPLDGVYVFSATIAAGLRNNTHAGIAVNDHVVTTMFVDGNDNRFDSTSHTIALTLQTGDKVMVRHLDSHGYISGGGNSLFTGFLLYQEYQETQLFG